MTNKKLAYLQRQFLVEHTGPSALPAALVVKTSDKERPVNSDTGLHQSVRRALPGLAQAGAAVALAVVLLVLAASAPIHIGGIRDDWQVGPA